jgi:type IV pilus assembly protein PilO
MAPPKLQIASFAQLPLGGKVFILVLLLALLTSGYYLGVHMSLEEATESAQQKHNSLEQQLKQAHERQKEYLKLREEVSAREALDRQNLRILPITAEIPAFLDDLNRLAELSGLRMDQVHPNPEAAEKFFVKVPVSLAIRGRYHELAKFFYNISRLERAINMEDIRVSVTDKVAATGEVSLAVSVRATTFRRKEP